MKTIYNHSKITFTLFKSSSMITAELENDVLASVCNTGDGYWSIDDVSFTTCNSV